MVSAILALTGLGVFPMVGVQAGDAAFKRTADAPRIVRWHIVGNVGIGYSRARVEQVYGFQETVPANRMTYYPAGNKRANDPTAYLDQIGVVYSDDFNQRATVTGIETSSPRYRTADGFGVGSRVPFRKTWNGFTRYVDPETGYWLYRYVSHAGRPLTVVLHVITGAVNSIAVYRGRVDVPRITPPGDGYYKKGQLPLPIVRPKSR